MLRDLVFNLEGVLFKYDFDSEGVSDKEVQEIKKVLNSEEWYNLQKGELRLDDFCNKVTTSTKLEPQRIADIFKVFEKIFRPEQKNIELLEELKEKGYNIYLVGNCYPELYDDICNHIPPIHLIDGKSLSFEVGVRVPDKGIYEALLKKYHLLAETTLFIDGSQENIDFTMDLGLNPLLVEDATLLREKLTEMDIL